MGAGELGRVDDNLTMTADDLLKTCVRRRLYRERFAMPETHLGVSFSAQIRYPRIDQEKKSNMQRSPDAVYYRRKKISMLSPTH
jgi:tRNA A37 threonylcarbamoyladenosine dehydratase